MMMLKFFFLQISYHHHHHHHHHRYRSIQIDLFISFPVSYRILFLSLTLSPQLSLLIFFLGSRKSNCFFFRVCANKTQILIQHRRRFSIVEIGFFYFFFCFDFCIKLNSSFINKLDFLYEVFFISRNSTNKISTTILLLLRKKNNDQFFGKTRKKTAGLQEKFFHKFLILNSKQEINKQIQVYIK